MIIRVLKNLFRTRTLALALWSIIYELCGHEWEGNTLTCQHPQYEVRIEHYQRGRLVGILKVKTCIICDLGS